MDSIYTMVILKELGLDPDCPQAQRAMKQVVEKLKWIPLNNRKFFESETEPCINGAILSIGAYFKQDCKVLLDLLLSHQLSDGGWNCSAPPSTKSSFHSTVRVLEGLLEYERSFGASDQTKKARSAGEHYILERNLFRSKQTVEVIDANWLKFAYPTTWHYDILRGLDYLRDAKTIPDHCLDEAVEIMMSRMHQNGRWPLNRASSAI